MVAVRIKFFGSASSLLPTRAPMIARARFTVVGMTQGNRLRRELSQKSCKIESLLHGGYSSVAERQTVALDVVGSTPTTHPNS